MLSIEPISDERDDFEATRRRLAEAERAILDHVHEGTRLSPAEVIERVSQGQSDLDASTVQKAYWALLHERRVRVDKDSSLVIAPAP